MKNNIRFVLDDRIIEIDFSASQGLKPTTTVLNYLRSLHDHKGVKEGCAEGDCGACTVVIAEVNAHGKLTYRTIDSCLVFLPMIHGKQLITVENLAKKQNHVKTLHPVQQMLAETNGSQCGYCTPGQMMAAEGLLRVNPNPSLEEIRRGMSGNLCRCGSYAHIFKAVEDAAKRK